MKKFLLLFLAIILATASYAQDVHFSQFNASPLTLNPALTGKLPCTFRAALNYRNQWNSVPAPYVTYSGAFDAGLFKNKLGGDAFGIGFLVMNDVSGDGNLQNMNFSAGVAYHKSLGENHLLSAGFQGSFVHKRIDVNELVFNSQITPDGIDLTLPSGEFIRPTDSYVDLHAGLHWSSVLSDKFSFNFGGAYYHIAEPQESFFNDPKNKLDPRYVGHGGFSVGLGDKMSLSPSVLYMTQAGAQEITAGTSLGMHMEDAIFYLGSWYRVNDAIIALVGLEFQNLMFGFSYDVTVSEASAATSMKGGFELSLTYNGCIATERKVFHCPKF